MDFRNTVYQLFVPFLAISIICCIYYFRPQKLSTYVFQNCQYVDKSHPILAVAAGEGLAGRELEPSTFNELVNYISPTCSIIWKRDFYTAEKEAAMQCCHWASGLSKIQIREVLGQPLFVGSWGKEAYPGSSSERWCYTLGGNKIPVVIKFTKDVCVEGSMSDWSADSNKYESRLWPPDAPKHHPILKVMPKQHLNPVNLDPNVFYKLKNYSIDGIFDWEWQQDYWQAEKEASQSFCKLSLGCSKDDLVKLVRQPFFKGASIPGWSCSKPGTEIWLYFFGRENIAVRLLFQGEKCVSAELCSSEERSSYYKFRAEKLCNNAIGKPFQWIIAEDGVPDDIDERNEKHPALVYKVYPSESAYIRFNKEFGGLCESTHTEDIAH